MTRTVTGPLEKPNGSALGPGTVRFLALRNNYTTTGEYTPKGATYDADVDAAGAMSVTLNLGDYRCLYQADGTTTWTHIGDIACETGTSIELGELIELSRDKTADYSISADWATKAYVASYVGGGGSPGDIDITALGLGSATADQFIRVNAGGTAVIGWTWDWDTTDITTVYSQDYIAAGVAAQYFSFG